MMGLEPLHLLLLFVWILWVGVDQRAWGALQVHQPIVAATVTGFLVGLPREGLLLGAALQALWIRPAPMGGAVPPMGGLGSCAGTLWLRLAADGAPNPPVLAWILLACVVLGTAAAGARVETALRRLNAALEDDGLRSLASTGRGLAPRVAAGIAATGAASLAVVAAAVAAAAAVSKLAAGAGFAATVRPVVALGILLGLGLGGSAVTPGRVSWKGLAWLGAGLALGFGVVKMTGLGVMP